MNEHYIVNERGKGNPNFRLDSIMDGFSEQWGVESEELATGCEKWAIVFSESVYNTNPNPKSICNTAPNPIPNGQHCP